MADPVLHIKDGYFFEVPKFLWTRNFQSRADVANTSEVWVRLDPDYQHWEAERLYHELEHLVADYNQQAASAGRPAITLPAESSLLHEFEHWQHDDHANFGRPFDAYLERNLASVDAEYAAWKVQEADRVDISFDTFLKETSVPESWFVRLVRSPGMAERWQAAKDEAEDVQAYVTDPAVPEWKQEKLEAYSYHLSGKVLIPQPFGKLRNLHEPESGINISRFMLVEVAVAIVIFAVYRWLAGKVASGQRPQGRLWNFLEVFLVFIRDRVARPAIGHHDADRFVPLLWTIFLFVLGCNLAGMLPWVGAPTGVWGITFGLAVATFLAVLVSGMRRFGAVGFWLNQVPHMDLPPVMAAGIKPLILIIEIAGLLIKHTVLSIRLLANMMAGHLVLLAIGALAFGVDAAHNFAETSTAGWGFVAVLTIVGSALLSCLELFVAFLQAYIFAFLSALFIGAAIHHH
jgi:F-type H+-transporting ATPase subunit a